MKPIHLALIIAGLVLLGHIAYALSLDYGQEKEVPCTDYDGNEIKGKICIESKDWKDGGEIILNGFLLSFMIFFTGIFLMELIKIKMMWDRINQNENGEETYQLT